MNDQMIITFVILGKSLPPPRNQPPSSSPPSLPFLFIVKRLYQILSKEHFIENKLVVAKGQGGGGGMDWEFGISRCKLLYIEWINNKAYCIAQGTIFNTL